MSNSCGNVPCDPTTISNLLGEINELTRGNISTAGFIKDRLYGDAICCTEEKVNSHGGYVEGLELLRKDCLSLSDILIKISAIMQ